MKDKKNKDFDPITPAGRAWRWLTWTLSLVLAVLMYGFWALTALTLAMAVFGDKQESALAACDASAVFAVLCTLLYLLFRHGIFEALWLALEFIFTRE